MPGGRGGATGWGSGGAEIGTGAGTTCGNGTTAAGGAGDVPGTGGAGIRGSGIAGCGTRIGAGAGASGGTGTGRTEGCGTAGIGKGAAPPRWGGTGTTGARGAGGTVADILGVASDADGIARAACAGAAGPLPARTTSAGRGAGFTAGGVVVSEGAIGRLDATVTRLLATGRPVVTVDAGTSVMPPGADRFAWRVGSPGPTTF